MLEHDSVVNGSLWVQLSHFAFILNKWNKIVWDLIHKSWNNNLFQNQVCQFSPLDGYRWSF